MSFIIAVHVNEGIVLASDSRTTYTETNDNKGIKTIKIGTHTTDTTQKTFLCANNIGISTCGTASINGMPITGYIENFIRENINEKTDIDSIPQGLIDYFNLFVPVPDTNFLVAGYKNDKGTLSQRLYKVRVKSKNMVSQDTNKQGATWDGEIMVLSRVTQNLALKKDDGTYFDLPSVEVPWGLFTLQDAINFAQYAVDVTIKTMHYQNAVETVGGPIDILVLKPNNAFWVQHKELHA